MRIRRFAPLVALSLLTACPCDTIEDPGNCWVEVGNVDAPTSLGWNDDVLVVGDASGSVACFDGSTWTSSSLGISSPVHWVSETPNGTDLPTTYVATDVGGTQPRLFEGGCDVGWTQRTTWTGLDHVSHALPPIEDIHNQGPNVVIALQNGKLLLSTDGGVLFDEITSPSSSGQATTAVVDAAGAIFVERFPDLFLWTGSWSTLTAAPGSAPEAIARVPGGGPFLVFSNAGDDVHRSASGAAWASQPLPESWAGLVVETSSVPLQSGPFLVAAREEAVVWSDDAGATWGEYFPCWPTSGLPTSTTFRDLDQDPVDTLVYLATSAGVYRENGNTNNPCYDPDSCLPPGPWCRMAGPGSGDPTLEETPWADGVIDPVLCPDVGCDAAFDDLEGTDGDVVGEVLVAHAAGVDVIPVSGHATWTAAPCDGGVCPFELGALHLEADLAQGEGLLGYVLAGVSSTLVDPARGGWRPASGELLLAGEGFTAETTMKSGWWGGGELDAAPNPLVGVVTGTVEGGTLHLATTQEVDGAVVTATIVIAPR